MNRPVTTTALFVSVAASFLAACYIQERPPPASGTGAPPPATATTAAPPPTATATTPPPTGPGPTTVATVPTPTGTGTAPFPTTMPAGGLTIPGVCIPIGSWTKQFDTGIPASGTVDIGTPVLFNQFPVSDGVVVATMPAGTLKGVGAMTSTNDLSVDVTNGGYTLSYTCKFSATGCNQGVCTTTKGGLGGFKLNKK
jgi:hypothetical protein